MPALIASGKRSHASMTAAKSGSDRGVFWGVVWDRISSVQVGSLRKDGIECSGVDAAETAGKTGVSTLPFALCRLLSEMPPVGLEPTTR